MPFGPYDSFTDCVSQNQGKDSPEAFCAWLQHQITGEWPAEADLQSPPAAKASAAMQPVYKVFVAVTKEVDGGLIEAIISTEAVDRDNEIVAATAMQGALGEYLKRPILLASHDYLDLQNQIGEIVSATVEGGLTRANIKYYSGLGNAQADWGLTLAKMGRAAYSIGFVPREWQDGKVGGGVKRTFTRIELLEVSQVTVPANREALASARTFGKLLSQYRHEAIESVVQMLLETKSPDVIEGSNDGLWVQLAIKAEGLKERK